MMIRTVLVALLAGILGASARAAAPNFILILADDQAWSGTPVPMIPGNPRSATPGIRMPHLQRMAREGMVFSQAYAGHPKSECSRASLLMGRSTTSLNAVQKDAYPWKAPASEALPRLLRPAQ